MPPPPPPTLSAVETLGGGCRMPCVQQVLSEALGACPAGAALAADKPGAKLDDASVATGAALIGARLAATAAAGGEAGALPAITGALDAERLASLVGREEAMAAADAAAAARGAVFNEMEGFVLEARNYAGRKHGEKVDSAALGPLLDEAEDWLYSEEARSLTDCMMIAR